MSNCSTRRRASTINRTTLLSAWAGGAVLLAANLSAAAAPLTVSDTYYGGLNTYNNNPPVSGDVIGEAAFEVFSATLNRTGNNLEVTINTNYVQNIGASSTGLGALFLGNGTPTYNNAGDPSKPITAPYAYDEFTANPGRFQYAVGIPPNPNTTSGTGTVYHLNGTGSDVQLSNDNGNTLTYPVDPNENNYFRTGQAVGVNNTAQQVNQALNVTATWSIGPGTLTFDITNAFSLLQDTFTFAWTMTCGNDVILETVTLPGGGGGQTTTPIPATLSLFASGAGLLGWFARSKKHRNSSIAVG